LQQRKLKNRNTGFGFVNILFLSLIAKSYKTTSKR
jgi:hypothetical protein